MPWKWNKSYGGRKDKDEQIGFRLRLENWWCWHAILNLFIYYHERYPKTNFNEKTYLLTRIKGGNYRNYKIWEEGWIYFYIYIHSLSWLGYIGWGWAHCFTQNPTSTLSFAPLAPPSCYLFQFYFLRTITYLLIRQFISFHPKSLSITQTLRTQA